MFKFFKKLVYLYYRIFNTLFRLYFSNKYFINLPHIFKISSTAVFLNKFKSKNINIDNSFCIGDFSKMSIEDKGAYLNIYRNVRIKDYCSIRVLGGKLEIGENVFMNNYSAINCLHEIKIGNKVMFGEGVKIYDHNHKYEYLNQELCIHPDDYTKNPIIINDNCWIGSNVVILKGVTIGHNSIIGAGCVIFKSVPPNSIIVNKQDLEIKQIQ